MTGQHRRAESGQIVPGDKQAVLRGLDGGNPLLHMGGVVLRAAVKPGAVQNIEVGRPLDAARVLGAQQQPAALLRRVHLDGQRWVFIHQPDGSHPAVFPEIDAGPGVQPEKAVEPARRQRQLLAEADAPIDLENLLLGLQILDLPHQKPQQGPGFLREAGGMMHKAELFAVFRRGAGGHVRAEAGDVFKNVGAPGAQGEAQPRPPVQQLKHRGQRHLVRVFGGLRHQLGGLPGQIGFHHPQGRVVRAGRAP